MIEGFNEEDTVLLLESLKFMPTDDKKKNSKRLVEAIRRQLIDDIKWVSACPESIFAEDTLLDGLEYFKSTGFSHRFYDYNHIRILTVCKPQTIKFTKRMAMSASSIYEEKLIKDIIDRSNYWLFHNIDKKYFNSIYETDSFDEAIESFCETVYDENIIVEFEEYEDDFTIGLVQERSLDDRVVYLLSDTMNQKIGITNDIKARIASIQNGNPLRVSVVAQYRPSVTARELEKALHRHFKEKRLKGEWFSINLSAEGFKEVCKAYDKIS